MGKATRVVRAAAAAAFLTLGGVGFVLVGGMAGCYSHVVRAKGVGADTVTVHEPYQEDSVVDTWFYGSRSSKGRSLITERSN